MKASMCFLAAVISLALATSLKSSAAVTVLCSSGPTSAIAGNSTWETIYSCTIPANTISTNQGIRITTVVAISGTSQGDTELQLHGVNVFGGGTPTNSGGYQYYNGRSLRDRSD